MIELHNRIELIKGNITLVSADAIVNSSNNMLTPGVGVNKAIHDAAGPELLDECLSFGIYDTGQVRITKGYNLLAKYVLHTVGPVWEGGNNNEAQLLAQCYTNCLKMAVAKRCQTIAFPNISTGVYGFPKKQAAEIALKTCVDFMKTDTQLRRLMLVCFDEENHEIYKTRIGELMGVCQ